MKKLFHFLCVMLVLFGLTACGKESTEPTISEKPSIPSYEDADEYTLLFTNDGMSLELPWDKLSKVLDGKHRDPGMISEAVANGEVYFSNLIKLRIVIYNYDDIKATGIQTELFTEISLLEDKDITASTAKPAPGTVSYIGDKYPAERLHQMQRLGFEHYGIQITGVYKIGYGEKISSEYTFKLQGKVKFEDKTDNSQLHTGKLSLTDTGAILNVKYVDILDEMGITLDMLKDVTSESIDATGILMYTSKQEYQLGDMEIHTQSFTEKDRPEYITVKMKYDRAWSNNQALLDEYHDVGQEMYVEIPMVLQLNNNVYRFTYYLRCDVMDMRSETEVQAANPATATKFTRSYVQADGMLPFVLYAPDTDTVEKPLVIWLHGSGECGTSEASYVQAGLPAVLSGWELNDFDAYIVCPISPGSWANEKSVHYIQTLIEYMSTHFSIDMDNISLAGHSLGGIGAIYIGGKMPDIFQRIAVLSGYPNAELQNIAAETRGWVGTAGEDSSSYSYMTGAEFREKVNGQVFLLDATHGAVPRKTFTIDENQDGFSDVFMWLCGIEDSVI